MKFGIGLRRRHHDQLDAIAAAVDFVELLAENFMHFGGHAAHIAREIAARRPVVIHGTALSIGGPDPLSAAYLDDLAAMADATEARWCSDHLCYSSAFGVRYHDLLPLPFTEAALAHVVARVRQVQDRLRRPFALENPSYYVAMPDAEMTEAEFVREVAARADCGLLLDVNNVYVNATNHGYDARAYIDAMPAGRVVQYHLAGHDDSGPFIVDTHGGPQPRAVDDLFLHAVRAIGPAWALFEWDNNVPPLATLLDEVGRLRALVSNAGAPP
ncbi:MAG: DUF692 domain-containing protein [Myxococcales bacterium]|nr:DUF692 domain-containing protein [Myxococcales bacterium]